MEKKLVLVRQLFEMVGLLQLATDMMEKTATAVFQQLAEMFGFQPSEEDTKEFQTMKKNYVQKFLEVAAPIYAEVFTEEDLEGLIAFYKTPLGKKMVEKTPEMTQRLMSEAMSLAQNLDFNMREKLESRSLH